MAEPPGTPTMNLLITLIALTVLVLEQRSADAVFNGRMADILDFPYMASLCHFRDSMCSGAIIGERHYLTAGHCIVGRAAPNHYIVAGSASLLSPEAIYLPAKLFLLHPEYQEGVYGPDDGNGKGRPQIQSPMNDIAIIEIWNEFPMKPVLPPQPGQSLLEYYLTRPSVAIDKIPWATKSVGQCTPCTFAGWGSSTPTFVDLFSFQLLHTTLFTSRCEGCFEGNCMNDPYTFCAHDPTFFTSTGRGDSGAPLVCNGVIAGVFSRSTFNPIYPSRFTNVALYKDWIQSIVLSPDLQ